MVQGLLINLSKVNTILACSAAFFLSLSLGQRGHERTSYMFEMVNWCIHCRHSRWRRGVLMMESILNTLNCVKSVMFTLLLDVRVLVSFWMFSTPKILKILAESFAWRPLLVQSDSRLQGKLLPTGYATLHQLGICKEYISTYNSHVQISTVLGLQLC